jgi:hypothetical protein
LIDADPCGRLAPELAGLIRQLRHLFRLDDVAGEEDDASEISAAGDMM